MTLYQKIKALCEKNGFSISSIGDKIPGLKVNKSSMTGWKNGARPRPDKIKAIADYFGVTVDYLLGKEDAPMTDASLSDSEKTMLAWFRSLSNDEQAAILRVFVEKNGGQQ